jgi:hypothetical protein
MGHGQGHVFMTSQTKRFDIGEEKICPPFFTGNLNGITQMTLVAGTGLATMRIQSIGNSNMQPPAHATNNNKRQYDFQILSPSLRLFTPVHPVSIIIKVFNLLFVSKPGEAVLHTLSIYLSFHIHPVDSIPRPTDLFQL